MFKQLTVIVFSAAAVIWTPAQSPQVQQPATKSQKTGQPEPAIPTSENVNAIIDDINGLRRQFGGGVASQLEGLHPDHGDSAKLLQSEFNRELSRLAVQQTQTIQRPSSATPALAPVTQSLSADGLQSPKTQPRPQLPASNVDSQVRTLRRAARRLEELAAEFEDVSRYREADELRTQATQFWQRARQNAPKPNQR